MKNVKVSPAVSAILASVDLDPDGRLRLPAQLDRALYVEVDKVLRCLGGKWNRSAKAHIFTNGNVADIRQALDEARATGSVIDKKKSFEQFDTPPELASRMVAMASIQPTDKILEPSAGLGNLIRPIDPDLCGGITAIEIDRERCEVLWDQLPWVDTFCLDFMTESSLAPLRQFDVVLMNPPFSRNQDIAHVRKAWSLLRPGGRLVAIVGQHSSFGTDKASREFVQWLDDVDANLEQLPAGTFKDSGTPIGAQLVSARKSLV
jgi:predicted RNA methylase